MRSSFDSLQPKPDNPTWFRGFNLVSSATGIFPCNFVILKDTNNNQDDDASTLQELAQVLRQWSIILLSLYKVCAEFVLVMLYRMENKRNFEV